VEIDYGTIAHHRHRRGQLGLGVTAHCGAKGDFARVELLIDYLARHEPALLGKPRLDNVNLALALDEVAHKAELGRWRRD
ncbi:hypothetical protein ABTL24_19780, partial [Acinetobacter baumannii]